MESRRTFLKIIAGLGAVIVPWTVLPEVWGKQLGALAERPAVKLIIPSYNGKNGAVKPSAETLDRKALEDIRALSHPDMQGRRAGTAGETRALVYLEEQMRSLNLAAVGGETYWQTFSIPSMAERIIGGRALFRPDETDHFRMPAANILGGMAGKNQEEAILLSAHFDHLGIYAGKLCRGSNDNASGVGCVLQVMRQLVRDYYNEIHPKCNIIAAFWGAEEMGFLGSKHFVKNPLIPLTNIKAVINYDTVGNGENKDFILWSTGDQSLAATVKESMLKYGATGTLTATNGHQSDESAFLGAKVPAVTVLSKEWLDKNHTPEDDISMLNEEKLDTACSVLYDIVRKLAY